MDDITVFELYNSFLKLHIRIKRTKNKTFKYCQQITPMRNIWTEEIYDSLDNNNIKSLIMTEIINGYTIKQNLLGLDFIDDIMTPIEREIGVKRKLEN